FIENPGFLIFFEYRSIGIHPPDLNVRILFFEVFSRTRYGSSCTRRYYKMGHFSIGLLPNLRTSGIIMGLPVAQIVVLITPVTIGDFIIELSRNRIVRSGIVG